MIRIFTIKWIGLAMVLPSIAFSTTYYVDGNCPSSGSGITVACGSNGPKKTIPEGLSLLSSPGDILNIRGVHPPHDGELCSGNINCANGQFDGRYSFDFTQINGKNGASGNPIIIQPHGWTAIRAGTQEAVYIEGTAAPGTGPNLGWTQCTSCSSGTCAGVPTSICNEVWWTNGSVTGHPTRSTSLVLAAERPDGKPTHRVTSIGSITNQFDSYSNETSGTNIFVRWGLPGSGYAPAEPLNPKPHVYFDSGYGFDIRNGSSWITIRGFTLRNFANTVITVSGGADNISIVDNKAFYVAGRRGNGADRPITLYSTAHATIDSNEIAYSGSEAIHTQAAGNHLGEIPTVLTITNNWIHHIGATGQSVLGTQPSGTPHGMIIGDSSDAGYPCGGGGVGAGDYTGTVIAGNLIEFITPNGGGQTCNAIRMENNTHGSIIRDNFIREIGNFSENAAGIELGASCGGCASTTPECSSNSAYGSNKASDHKVFNNVIVRPGGPCFKIESQPSMRADNNLFFNNDCVDPGAVGGGYYGLASFCSGSCAGNIFRNNIFFSSTNSRLVNWTVGDSSNKFQNNLIYPGSTSWTGNAILFNGKNSTCSQVVPSADVDNDGILNDNNKCADPLFISISGNNFHLTSTSPAINAGTSTGMPTGKMRDINNTLASQHGLPSYADNQLPVGVWDIGADEVGSSDTVPPKAPTNLRAR